MTRPGRHAFPTEAVVLETGIRGLYRLAAGGPSAPLLVSADTGGALWELDWQSKQIVQRYRPQRMPWQRLWPPAACASGAQSLERPLREIRAIVQDADGPSVISSDRGAGQTHLVDLRSGQRRLISSGRPAFTAACTVPIRTIALGGYARITLLQWPGGRLLGELAGHADGVRDMAISPDGDLLVSIGGESEDEQHRDAIRLWHVPSGAEQRSWLWHHLGAVAFHPGGEIIAVGCMMPAAIKLWRLAGDAIETVAVPAPGGISALCYSPDGRRLWAGDREGRIMLHAIHGFNSSTDA